jgi:hypothetical protein
VISDNYFCRSTTTRFAGSSRSGQPTHCEELGVTIAGVIFVHLMFQFVLAWSGWRYIAIAMGETYEALLSGLQGALWELRGSPLASDRTISRRRHTSSWRPTAGR